MPRLIDADKLLEIYKKWIPQLLSKEDEGDRRGVETCIAVLEDMQTVDAVEVVHGRWEWFGPYRYNDDGIIGTCSVCKERLRLFAYNYCPNCGARMDALSE